MRKQIKKFKRSDWSRLETHLLPSQNNPMIKRDENGDLWAWEHAGKWIEAKRWAMPLIEVLAGGAK